MSFIHRDGCQLSGCCQQCAPVQCSLSLFAHPHPHSSHNPTGYSLVSSAPSPSPLKNPVDFCRACKSSAMVMVMSLCHCFSLSLDHWPLIGGALSVVPLLCGVIKVSNKIPAKKRKEKSSESGRRGKASSTSANGHQRGSSSSSGGHRLLEKRKSSSWQLIA